MKCIIIKLTVLHNIGGVRWQGKFDERPMVIYKTGGKYLKVRLSASYNNWIDVSLDHWFNLNRFVSLF